MSVRLLRADEPAWAPANARAELRRRMQAASVGNTQLANAMGITAAAVSSALRHPGAMLEATYQHYLTGIRLAQAGTVHANSGEGLDEIPSGFQMPCKGCDGRGHLFDALKAAKWIRCELQATGASTRRIAEVSSVPRGVIERILNGQGAVRLPTFVRLAASLPELRQGPTGPKWDDEAARTHVRRRYASSPIRVGEVLEAAGVHAGGPEMLSTGRKLFPPEVYALHIRTLDQLEAAVGFRPSAPTPPAEERAKRLLEHMDASNVTLPDLAEELGLTRSTVHTALHRRVVRSSTYHRYYAAITRLAVVWEHRELSRRFLAQAAPTHASGGV